MVDEKRLPTGIQTFKEIIEDGYVYVDKTEFIHKLVNNGKIYFLSRPRRFGKSLLISTLEELFKGSKDLFKGYYIEDKYDWNKSYPIIRLDFGNISHNTNDELKLSLNKFLNDTAIEFNIVLEDINLIADKFGELIRKIYEKTGKKIVILVDEYDKSITSHIDNIKLAKANRNTLREFYQVLKSNDRYLHFLFITGVTKFAKTSIFSDLNHLKDITLNPLYSTLCGYTQNELEHYFNNYIEENSLSQNISKSEMLNYIKDWYNGYSWDGENFIYNPFSILNFLEDNEFNNYWFDSGTAKMLVDLIKEGNVDINIIASKTSSFTGLFPSFELNNIDFATVLLQNGYMTIKNKKTIKGEKPIYSLAIPNKEVEESLFNYIIGTYINTNEGFVDATLKNMLNYIINLDNVSLQRSIESQIHKIPNILYGELKKEIEAHYKILTISWMQLLGFEIDQEIMTIKGRLDGILKRDDLIVIMEFKFSKTKSFDYMIKDAFNQIIKKEYYKPYQNKKVILLALAFKPRDVKCELKTLYEVLSKVKK
ncbi:MAG: ATP-binding protein [Methanobrevibacter sp.]|jgi:hypothetical protein|nr:ATP-binding protein [Candidatus Methanoflexus mossambicus]